jgi:hypothetical protein
MPRLKGSALGYLSSGNVKHAAAVHLAQQQCPISFAANDLPTYSATSPVERTTVLTQGRHFDITIRRDVSSDGLGWPSADELESETLGGNRSYAQVGIDGWDEVAAFVEEERQIVEKLHASDDVEAAHEAWMEEDYEAPVLYGFDLGTNALTAALAAARCLPFYGCNGGAFGGDHNDTHPLVAFFCRAEIFPFVFAAAERSGTGLEYNHARGITAFGQNVEALIAMAASLYDLHSHIDAVSIASAEAGTPLPDAQGELF